MEAASFTYENLSEGKDCLTKGVAYSWCPGSYAEPIYLYITEPAGETSIYGGQEKDIVPPNHWFHEKFITETHSNFYQRNNK